MHATAFAWRAWPLLIGLILATGVVAFVPWFFDLVQVMSHRPKQ
jgi:hypothetical protein